MKPRQYWESMGDEYKDTATLIPWAGRLTNSYIRHVQKSALKEIKSLLYDKEILEIGCGSGYWFDYFRRWGAEDVYGIDISGSILGLARTEKVAQASATNLPFGSRAFDVVITVTMLQHLPSKDDLRESLREIKRVLKKGEGRAFLLELSQPHSISLSSPLLSISKSEWGRLFRENGLLLESSHPVDPSVSMFILDQLVYRAAKLIGMGQGGDKGLGQASSSGSKLVSLYYFVKGALSIPSILLMGITRKLCPWLSAHWIYVLRAEVNGT